MFRRKKKKTSFQDDPRPLCNFTFVIRNATNLPNTDASDLSASAKNVADPYCTFFLYFESLLKVCFTKGDRNEAPYGCEKPLKYLFRFSMETTRLAVALETTANHKKVPLSFQALGKTGFIRI